MLQARQTIFHKDILNSHSDFKKSIVTHHCKGCSLLWYDDTDQPRSFILNGDTLIIGDSKTWKRILVKTD